MAIPYLYEHPNKHAPVRSNGIRFHGYPQRRLPIQVIGIHTAENLPDIDPPDNGAEAVAKYFATTNRAASAHVNVDSDSTVRLLPDTAVAFAARGWNTVGWHIELCTRARSWDHVPDTYADAIVDRAAVECATTAIKFGIPPVRISLSQARRGKKGFVAHADLDPTRRSDPGARFPWRDFLRHTAHYIERGTPIDDGEGEPMQAFIASIGTSATAYLMDPQTMTRRRLTGKDVPALERVFGKDWGRTKQRWSSEEMAGFRLVKR